MRFLSKKPVLAIALTANMVGMSGQISWGQADPVVVSAGVTAVTGFSGVRTAKEFDRNSTAIDETFIDGSGISLQLLDMTRPGHVWDGREDTNIPQRLSVPARRIGQVFGVAFDRGDEDDLARGVGNVFVTATSAFGLNLVIPDADDDGLPERIKTAQTGAIWMKNQWGDDARSGPGSIYKIDGETGEVTLFANVELNGEPNSGAGLGNIAYDSAHNQLIVSDRDTGMIHRFDKDGNELEIFDHGIAGRRAINAAEVPFDPENRLHLQEGDFDAEDPETWGYANEQRRVWGVAVHGGRLWYALARGVDGKGPQIWSLGIDKVTGRFSGDPRWELDVWEKGPGYEISDIAFSKDGAMVLAQRGAQDANYDYSTFMKPRKARVYRYWRESPNDPATPSDWILEPEEYAVGFQPNHRNSNGGVAFGYGYTERGRINKNACGESVWFTGETLRVNQSLRTILQRGGETVLHGIQGSPYRPVRNFNTPPWASYFVDYNMKYEDPQNAGHIGDVEVFTPGCGDGLAEYDDIAFGPSWTTPVDWGTPLPPYCTGDDCPPPDCSLTGTCEVKTECMALDAELFCDPATGNFVLRTNIGGTLGFDPDRVKISSGSPGITLPGAPVVSASPANIDIRGALPFQPVDIDLCAYNATEAGSGKPSNCCRATTRIIMPAQACVKK